MVPKLHLTSEGLGDMFESDFADMCADIFLLMSMVGQGDGLVCIDSGARTPVSISGNFTKLCTYLNTSNRQIFFELSLLEFEQLTPYFPFTQIYKSRFNLSFTKVIITKLWTANQHLGATRPAARKMEIMTIFVYVWIRLKLGGFKCKNKDAWKIWLFLPLCLALNETWIFYNANVMRMHQLFVH